MLKVSGIGIRLQDEEECRGGKDVANGLLVQKAAEALGLEQSDIAFVRVVRRSVDARRKSNVHFVVNLSVQLANSAMEQSLLARGVPLAKTYRPLEISQAPMFQGPSPVVVGMGPAGLFAALYLARAGMRPVVLERGFDVETRAQDVARFNTTGVLDPNSNIQFGEGGAGTFSDGKLSTNTNNRFTDHVLHWFVEAGAPEEVVWDAQPHIGSDRLPAVVAHMREEIVRLGGEVHFGAQLANLDFENGGLRTATFADVRTGETETLPCACLVLACGHSARDTFSMLQDVGLHLEQKPFAIGVRIEHRQDDINRAQWGASAGSAALGAASYKLAAHGCAGRSVYTFCMCPGGEVVSAASEEGGIATNGMSPFARGGRNANAAVLVNVLPSDFGGSADPLAGVRFQQQIEQRAFEASLQAGGSPYQLPSESVGSFLARGASSCAGGSLVDGVVPSSCARGVAPCDLRTILPEYVCEAIAQALPQFDRKLKGFANPAALLSAPETRSSSPVRIARNEDLQAWFAHGSRACGCGVYPAGEGAGYAGGIMSAACDGLRVAEAIVGGTMCP